MTCSWAVCGHWFSTRSGQYKSPVSPTSVPHPMLVWYDMLSLGSGPMFDGVFVHLHVCCLIIPCYLLASLIFLPLIIVSITHLDYTTINLLIVFEVNSWLKALSSRSKPMLDPAKIFWFLEDCQQQSGQQKILFCLVQERYSCQQKNAKKYSFCIYIYIYESKSIETVSTLFLGINHH